MTIYDDAQKIASNLLKDFKQGAIQLVEVVPGRGPENNPGPSTEVIHNIPGGTARGVSWKYIQNGLATTADKQCVLPADGVVPKNGWKLMVDGVEYVITHVEPRPGAGVPAVYIVIGKK